MTLAFRSNNITINSTAGASCVVTAPSGITDDDILIFMLDRAVVTGAITLSGFTQLSLTTHDGGTLYVAWKRASSESGDYTASWTGDSRNVGMMYAISGAVTDVTPVVAGSAATGSGTTPDPPSVDPILSTDRFAIAIFGQEGKSGSATAPTGYTEPSNSDGYTSGGGAAADHCGLVAAHKSYIGRIEDPGTFSLALADGWAAQTLIFTPVGAAVTQPRWGIFGQTYGSFENKAVPAITLTADTGVYLVTGNTATTTHAKSLTADTGTYLVTGNTAALQAGFKLAAVTGVYLVTGNTAATSKTTVAQQRTQPRWGIFGQIYGSFENKAAVAVTLTADTGVYLVTGNAAATSRGRPLVADTGTYIVSGFAANTVKGRVLAAVSGVYVVTGNTAALQAGFKLAAVSGTYLVTGNTATVFRGRTLSAVAGTYLVTGNTIVTRFGRTIAAVAGSYTITGNAATVFRGRTLLASFGLYNITGFAATTKSGATILPFMMHLAS